jgi:hypothetical protein
MVVLGATLVVATGLPAMVSDSIVTDPERPEQLVFDVALATVTVISGTLGTAVLMLSCDTDAVAVDAVGLMVAVTLAQSFRAATTPDKVAMHGVVTAALFASLL